MQQNLFDYCVTHFPSYDQPYRYIEEVVQYKKSVDGEEPGSKPIENVQYEMQSYIQIIVSFEQTVFLLKNSFLSVVLPALLKFELGTVVDGVMPAVEVVHYVLNYSIFLTNMQVSYFFRSKHGEIIWALFALNNREQLVFDKLTPISVGGINDILLFYLLSLFLHFRNYIMVSKDQIEGLIGLHYQSKCIQKTQFYNCIPILRNKTNSCFWLTRRFAKMWTYQLNQKSCLQFEQQKCNKHANNIIYFNFFYVINIGFIMSVNVKYQQEKNIEQPNIIEEQKVEQNIVESKHFQEYKQAMQFKGKSLSQGYLLQKLMNKQIKIHQTPSKKQLDIISVNTSKNYEIVDLQVKIGLYSLKIHIVNNQGQSPIHNQSWIAEGTFGKIYQYTSHSGQRKAVKCIQIRKNTRFQQEIFKVIHQYALLKIANAVESGPEIASQNFDIICYKNSKHPIKNMTPDSEQLRCCIQFQMELCDTTKILSPQQIQPLYQSLYNLHLLGCTHNDIKPDNILFSPTLNKWVYLDYGVSSCNKQKIGQCSFAYFRGTLQYSTAEVAKLLSKGPEFVDLYWNDVHGLQLSLKHLKKLRKEGIKANVQKDDKVDIDSHYLLIKLKYYLYYYNFPEIKNLCLKIKWETMQKKCLFYFILQLEFIPEELKNFLGKLIENWSDIQTIQFVNPKQFFGIVTSSLSFRNQKVSKLKAIEQKFTTFKQMASILIEQLDLGNSDNNLNQAIFKKQYKKWVKMLQNEKEVREMQETSYILMLFQFVDLIKSKMTISLIKKSIICKVFQQIKTLKQVTPQKQLYNQPLSEQIKEFSLQAIKFFISYLIKEFIQKQTQWLVDLFPRLYLNYLMLGLAETSTIKSVYQTIESINLPLGKQIQYFTLVYQNKFWYEKVIFMREIVDIFEIRKTQLKLMNKLYYSFSFKQEIKDKQQHTCSQQEMCFELQKEMFKAISKFNRTKNNSNGFDQRLNNYSFILQKLNRNLAHIILDSNTVQPAQTLVLQLQSNKSLGRNLSQIRFSQSQIPLNLCQFFTAQLFGLNPESLCEAAQHVQYIINYQQITQFWFIVILKNLYKFQQERSKSKILKYFISIQQIYSHQSQNRPQVLYMVCFHRMRLFFLKLFVRYAQNQQNQLLWFINNKLQETNKLIGDQFTEEQLAQFLVALNQTDAMAIWQYVRLINKEQNRFTNIMQLLLTKISALSCGVQRRVKMLSYTIFSNIHGNINWGMHDEHTINLNKIVFESVGKEQILQLKLCFIEHWVFKLLVQHHYAQSKVQLYYLEQLSQILKIQDCQAYFLTQELRYQVFILYFIYLLKNKLIQKALELVQKLCHRILNYMCKQTNFLLLRLKNYLFNYYLCQIDCFIKEWPIFREQFIKLSNQKKHSTVKLLNIFCLYIDLNYVSIYKLNLGNKVDRISFRNIMIMSYRALKILDEMNLSYRLHQIDCYYRCWIILLQTQFKSNQRQFVKKRFLSFIAKKHKKVIQIQLKNNIRIKQDQLFFYGHKNKIQIRYRQIEWYHPETCIHLAKFKEKLNDYYSQQKSLQNTYIRCAK